VGLFLSCGMLALEGPHLEVRTEESSSWMRKMKTGKWEMIVAAPT